MINLRYLNASISKNNVTDLSKRTNRNNVYRGGKVYGKLNLFTYDNEEDIDSDLGRVYFNTNNENAAEVKELIKISNYSASTEISVSGNVVLNALIYNTTDDSRTSLKNRICYFEPSDGDFPFNLRFGQMSFERLYSSHYFDFINATKRERSLTLKALINNEIFNHLQTNPLIYVDFMESIFFVSSINGYSDNKLTDLEVVRFN